ncbi:MAG: 5-formyltetrahydrofolate cyclo-ligase [Inquilinaceae bacterium]
MPPGAMTVDGAASAGKQAARRAARARRAAARTEVSGAAGRVRDLVLSQVPVAGGARVAGYHPLGDELDVLPLLTAFHENGHSCLLPVVLRGDRPLIFRAWRPGLVMAANRYGIAEPGPECEEASPDVVLVPLLAFDRAGHRMGYGAGFYDRTLAHLRAAGPVCAVGVAFAAQEQDTIPAEAHDQPLDWIVTEREAIRATAAGEGG